MLGRSLLGLSVIVSEMDDSLIEELTQGSLPVVFHDVGRATPNAIHITVDWEKPMQRTVEYLHSLGHRKMAFIGHNESLASLHARRTSLSDMAAPVSLTNRIVGEPLRPRTAEELV
jgi:DNA-binding LacI/PurR family transcriptional regulator